MKKTIFSLSLLPLMLTNCSCNWGKTNYRNTIYEASVIGQIGNITSTDFSKIEFGQKLKDTTYYIEGSSFYEENSIWTHIRNDTFDHEWETLYPNKNGKVNHPYVLQATALYYELKIEINKLSEPMGWDGIDPVMSLDDYKDKDDMTNASFDTLNYMLMLQRFIKDIRNPCELYDLILNHDTLLVKLRIHYWDVWVD